jgi:hypothetical protein
MTERRSTPDLVWAVLLLALVLAPVSAAVRPPRMQYSIATLPNGLTVVLLRR